MYCTCKCGGLCQRGNRVAHQHKAGKQEAKAHQHGAHAGVFFLFDEHQQDYSRDHSDRGQSIRVEEIQNDISAGVYIHKADKLSGNCGADVGAHYDADGLAKVKYACAKETYGQHDGGGGTLDNGGYQRAGNYAHHHALCYFFQHGLKGF